jgi:hypothetical protein
MENILQNIVQTCLLKLILILWNNETWMKYKGWKEKKIAQEHGHSKHGLLNVRTREVKKWDLVELIVVAT